MPFLTLGDGNEMFYKNWGVPTGPAVVFSHGWPLSADNWDNQMSFLGNKGYHVIAHDRRGHGRSGQSWDGNDMDTYADDLLELFVHLKVKNATLVGHSTGGGEVARFVGRHGTERVAKAALVSAITPVLGQSESNPDGVPLEVFDNFRSLMSLNRAQFFLEVAKGPFFGFNRPGANVSQGLIDSWWLQGMLGGFKSSYDSVKALSETDFSEDLKKMDIPVLVIHGDDDQIVPVNNSHKAVELLPKGQLKVYPGASHALPDLAIDQLNRDLLEFIQSN